jgi:hypothetical protein
MRSSIFALLFVIASSSTAFAAANPASVAGDAPPSPKPSVTLDVKKFSRDQVRLRILDACMYQRGKEADESTEIFSGCQCYAKKVVAAMTEADFETYKVTRRFEGALRATAETAYATCVK